MPSERFQLARGAIQPGNERGQINLAGPFDVAIKSQLHQIAPPGTGSQCVQSFDRLHPMLLIELLENLTFAVDLETVLQAVSNAPRQKQILGTETLIGPRTE